MPGMIFSVKIYWEYDKVNKLCATSQVWKKYSFFIFYIWLNFAPKVSYCWIMEGSVTVE